jgi:hypothetical protein
VVTILEPELLVEGKYVTLSLLDSQQTQDLLEFLNNKYSAASSLINQGPARQILTWIDMCYEHIDHLEYIEILKPKEVVDPLAAKKIDKKQRTRFGKIVE